MYLKAVKHIKLNTLSKPCEEASEYKYQDCIQEKVLSQIGCVPYWLKSSKKGIPRCSEVGQIRMYYDIIYSTAYLSEPQIRDQFNCLKPCTYTEYQVKKWFSIIFCIRIITA